MVKKYILLLTLMVMPFGAGAATDAQNYQFTQCVIHTNNCSGDKACVDYCRAQAGIPAIGAVTENESSLPKAKRVDPEAFTQCNRNIVNDKRGYHFPAQYPDLRAYCTAVGYGEIEFREPPGFVSMPVKTPPKPTLSTCPIEQPEAKERGFVAKIADFFGNLIGGKRKEPTSEDRLKKLETKVAIKEIDVKKQELILQKVRNEANEMIRERNTTGWVLSGDRGKKEKLQELLRSEHTEDSNLERTRSELTDLQESYTTLKEIAQEAQAQQTPCPTIDKKPKDIPKKDKNKIIVENILEDSFLNQRANFDKIEKNPKISAQAKYDAFEAMILRKWDSGVEVFPEENLKLKELKRAVDFRWWNPSTWSF